MGRTARTAQPTEATTTLNEADNDEGGVANLGVLTEQPTVKREPVTVELPDGTLRIDY